MGLTNPATEYTGSDATTVSSISPNWVTTKLDFLVNWGRANSLWPMPFATACCGIELMATGASKLDWAAFVHAAAGTVAKRSIRPCETTSSVVTIFASIAGLR